MPYWIILEGLVIMRGDIVYVAQAQALLVKVPHIRYSPLALDGSHIRPYTGFDCKSAIYKIFTP